MVSVAITASPSPTLDAESDWDKQDGENALGLELGDEYIYGLEAQIMKWVPRCKYDLVPTILTQHKFCHRYAQPTSVVLVVVWGESSVERFTKGRNRWNK